MTISAESIDEAVRKGIEQLGASSNQDVTVTVIEQPRNGFMVFGGRPAEVAVGKTPGFRQREEEERRTRVAAAEGQVEGTLARLADLASGISAGCAKLGLYFAGWRASRQ